MEQPSQVKSDEIVALQQWVAGHLLGGESPEQVISALVERGIAINEAEQQVVSANEHPYLTVARDVAGRLQRIEYMLDFFRQLDTLTPSRLAVPRRSGLSAEEFLDSYYAANRPVIVTDLVPRWRAHGRWSPLYLRDRYGESTVEVEIGRAGDPQFIRRKEEFKRSVRLADYVDLVLAGGETNDHYLVGNSYNLDRDGLRGLLDDIDYFPDYLADPDRARRLLFWFGPAGTVTPLHHDHVNSILAQLYGRKRVRLYPPTQTPLMYNSFKGFSDVDCEVPDFNKFPRFRDATPMDVILNPGEALFIPIDWWHHVRSLEVSMNVSLLNFTWMNWS